MRGEIITWKIFLIIIKVLDFLKYGGWGREKTTTEKNTSDLRMGEMLDGVYKKKIVQSMCGVSILCQRWTNYIIKGERHETRLFF